MCRSGSMPLGRRDRAQCKVEHQCRREFDPFGIIREIMGVGRRDRIDRKGCHPKEERVPMIPVVPNPVTRRCQRKLTMAATDSQISTQRRSNLSASQPAGIGPAPRPERRRPENSRFGPRSGPLLVHKRARPYERTRWTRAATTTPAAARGERSNASRGRRRGAGRFGLLGRGQCDRQKAAQHRIAQADCRTHSLLVPAPRSSAARPVIRSCPRYGKCPWPARGFRL